MKNKEEQCVYLWVLDFNDGQVYKYAVKLYADESEYLKILEDVGHELSKIEWMISPYYEAIDATTDSRFKPFNRFYELQTKYANR